MKFINIATIVTTILLNGAYACKCLDGAVNIERTTQFCCLEQNGNYQSNGDCQAASISESLTNFASCCSSSGYESDCDCPSGCFAEAEAGAEAESAKQ